MFLGGEWLCKKSSYSLGVRSGFRVRVVVKVFSSAGYSLGTDVWVANLFMLCLLIRLCCEGVQ